MATDYLKDWNKKTDSKGGFHLTHKSGNHTVSFLPNKEKGGYDVKHSGKLVGHHPHSTGALKIAAGYFKNNYNKEPPANVNFASNSNKNLKKARIDDGKTVFNKIQDRNSRAHYFKDALQKLKGEFKSGANKDMAKITHKLNMKAVGIKPNLPKSEMKKADYFKDLLTSKLSKSNVIDKLKANRNKNISGAKKWSKDEAKEMHDTYHKALKSTDSKNHPVLKEKIKQLESAHPHLKNKAELEKAKAQY